MDSIRHLLKLDDLRSQLIFWMVIVTVVPMIMMTLSLFYYFYSPLLNQFIEVNFLLLQNHLFNEQTTEAGRLVDQIDAFLDEIKIQGEMFNRLLSLDFLTQSEKNWLISSFLDTYGNIDFIIIRDIDDQVRSVGRQGKTLSSQLQTLISDPMFFQLTLAGEVSFSDPFLIEGTKELAMTVSMPVLSNLGQPLGALFMQVDLERVQQLTDAANKAKSGTIYVVDSEGILMGHVDRSRVLAREDMRELEIVKNYLIPRIASGTIPYKNKNGEDVQGAFAPVDDLYWGVVTERLHAHAFSSIIEMRATANYTIEYLRWATLLGVGFTALLAFGMGALLAMRITSPIRQISNGAIEIAGGDFSRRFEPQGAAEIRQLGSVLNYMSEEIEKYTKDLAEQARKMHRLFIGSVESLAAAIDAKDPYTQGHSRRVTIISVMIGQQLKMSKDILEELQISALMHDVGKLGINDAILKKPGRVTDDELDILKTHPVLGATIMKPIPQLRNMIPGMLYHHERWDGNGYPDGLSGEGIPLYGRIIAVADTFDAMTSNRPYQETQTYNKARDLIKDWSGTRYDPHIVEAFLAVFPKICDAIQEESISPWQDSAG